MGAAAGAGERERDEFVREEVEAGEAGVEKREDRFPVGGLESLESLEGLLSIAADNDNSGGMEFLE